MARTKRSDLPDGPFHVIAHAVSNELLFYDELDYKIYLGLLQQTMERYRWELFTFVLMGNHVHLLVVSTTRDLSAGLWWLHWHYAGHVHRRYTHRRGHVFESRPKTPPIKDDRYLLAVMRYIANNPVKHGFCSRPEEHRWSAHRAILGLSPPMPLLAIDKVLKRFSTDQVEARARYRAFVSGANPDKHRDVCRWAEGQSSDRPTLSELLATGTETDAIVSAHVEWGYSIRAIASASGLSSTTIARRIGARG